jgi:hypothetical protein
VRTAGVDPSSQNANSAACVFEWSHGKARIVSLAGGAMPPFFKFARVRGRKSRHARIDMGHDCGYPSADQKTVRR